MIYTNGYVTFGLNFASRYPHRLNKDILSYAKRQTAKKQGFAMLAPLWTDNDARTGDVYYHIYDLTQPGSTSSDQARVKHAIDHARYDVITSGGLSVTDVTWVMVVTWKDMVPRLYYSIHDSPNTFQLVIAYDASRYQTFATYIYKDMGWDDKYTIRRSMIGYLSYKQNEENFKQLAPSMKSTAFRLHTRIGNTGERGRYMFRVASGSQSINYDQKCYNWYAKEMRRISLVRYYWRQTLVCPCDMRLAMMDGRWTFDKTQFDETNSERRCMYERIPWEQSTQECCYTWSGSLISTDDGLGGQTFFFHPRWWRQHQKYDVLPKKWCCQYTDNCEYFYKVRPMDHCRGYTPLFIGWFYGDPHIRTLDGFEYTFNGLGEYTLIETTHSNFTLQGRTAKARDANGTQMDATVFSAFTAKDVDSDTVHVEMTAARDGLAVFVENENVTSWFSAANVTGEAEHTAVILTKAKGAQIKVTFKSGFSLTIGVSAEQLDITVGASDKFKNNTKGLMGVFNGDSTDDLLPPGKNALPLSNSSSEKTIFNEFGEKWRIDAVDSLFFYAPGETHATYAHTEFQPLFLEDVLANMTAAQRTKAEQTCGNNKECLFDFAVTGKEEAAAATLATNAKNKEDAETLSNASPNIIVDAVFKVTVNEVNNLIVTVVDQDGDTVNLTLLSDTPSGATFKDHIYSWTPTSMDPANISFTASDGKGGIATANISINLCNCSGHGECLFDLLADGYELKQTFRIVQCNCSVGWEGDYCELDLDGCQDNPCTEDTNCTDVTPAEQVATGKSYNCSDCPAGKEKNEGICLPINECDPANPRHDCEQICVDQRNSFTCTCNEAYRLLDNRKNCTDIDECLEGTSGCEQECTNTNGSFVCSCLDGYKLNTDIKTCNMSNALKATCDHLDCAYGCKDTGLNEYVCFCRTGYVLSSDNKTCEDTNECSTTNGGCAHRCTNFDGGFNCSCNDGYQLMNDKIQCKPCPSGTWGKDCLRDCNCQDSDTECNMTTGCGECSAGFTGGDCHDDIDECTINNPCDSHATCNNTIGTFKCVCQTGFTQYNATVCQDLDECESDPCLNGGECQNQDSQYFCICPDGYIGSQCETDIDECNAFPCQNNGTCKDLINTYRCSCMRGFAGRNCETEIDICDSSPCKNGANCSQNMGKYVCNCVAGYTGPTCDQDIDECVSSPCQHGATCSMSLVNMFTCKCASGYTGTNCETEIDECHSSPCYNGGTCQDKINGYGCSCLSSYNGTNCELGIQCRTTPCQNKGICSEISGVRTCKCVGSFSGKNCERSLVTTLKGSEITRLNIKVKLTSTTFKASLSNKDSIEYKTLKNEVVNELKGILDAKLGPGKYEVVDVNFQGW
ncbi:Mucin-like protein [Lamellibrachia satsuma]|nr:Mucin-like protein [Lamellibrachia satsuma]